MPLIRSEKSQPPRTKIQPVYIGVDPGKSGGMAALIIDEVGETLNTCEMPETEHDIWQWFHHWNKPNPVLTYKPFAVIERVSAMPGNGVAGMFKFGASYGGLRMALTAAGIPFVDIQPQKWQSGLAIPSRKKDEPKPQFKKRLQAKAQQMYPAVKITLGTADSVLLARYAMLWTQGRVLEANT